MEIFSVDEVALVLLKQILYINNQKLEYLLAAGLVVGGAAAAAVVRVVTATAGRGAGGARIPELAAPPPPPPVFPLPNGLKRNRILQKNQLVFLTYCPSRAATGS